MIIYIAAISVVIVFMIARNRMRRMNQKNNNDSHTGDEEKK
jgi:preprotein translocase subunit YajC